jgi:feruloyl esterase
LKSIFLLALLGVCSGSAWAAATPCDELAKLKLTNTEITGATLVEKGAFTPPAQGGNQGPGGPGGPAGQGAGARAQNAIYKTMPSFCRVTATLRPTSDSEIKMEVWLPAEGWNGRLEETGNGGFGSNIGYQDLAQFVAKGYAATGSNTGHEGRAGDSLIGHPEKVIDWGYRAVHETTVAAKAIIAAHYGSGPKYSYWNACSTGGRQGWVSAKYYPNDFDGLAIGDPANPMTRLQAGSIWSNMVVNKDDASFIPAAKWIMIHDAVMNKCDAVDGLKDGLIEDPMACKFEPKSLLCKEGDGPDCLTAAQVDSLSKLTSGAVNPRTGENFYPGWPAATRQFPGPVLGNKQGAPPQQDALDTFRVLFQKSDWDYRTMDFDKDIALSDKLGNNLMNAVDETRLKPLFDRGGKILLYHGWSDPNITPLISIQYYNSAVAANGGLDKANNEVRLFMVPGMGHCGGGDGPNVFDKIDVLSDWVEHGKAPDQIIASHLDADGHLDRTRPLCPYPQIAKYKGTGNINDAENFVCAAP